jgi:hypothetical protein
VSALGALQRDFLSALFAAEEPVDRGARVYRRNVLANLGGALAATYPVVRRLVGDAFFDEAARRHSLAIASTSGDLNRYGATFAAFLAAYEHAGPLPYLPDVARLEWALHECNQAQDGAPPGLAALADAAPGEEGTVRIALVPAVRLVASSHPILAIWEANQPQQDGTPQRPAGAERVLVRRSDEGAIAERVDDAEWALLSALDGGACLDAACDAMGAHAARLPAALARFAAAGILRDAA